MLSKKKCSHIGFSLFSEITQLRLIKKKVPNKMKRRTQTIYKKKKKSSFENINQPLSKVKEIEGIKIHIFRGKAQSFKICSTVMK